MVQVARESWYSVISGMNINNGRNYIPNKKGRKQLAPFRKRCSININILLKVARSPNASTIYIEAGRRECANKFAHFVDANFERNREFERRGSSWANYKCLNLETSLYRLVLLASCKRVKILSPFEYQDFFFFLRICLYLVINGRDG